VTEKKVSKFAARPQPLCPPVSNHSGDVSRQPAEEAGQPQVRHQLHGRRGAPDRNGPSGKIADLILKNRFQSVAALAFQVLDEN
jgi:hypothetical protein